MIHHNLRTIMSNAAASSVIYSTAGDYIFTLPYGVNVITIKCWGAGGAGGYTLGGANQRGGQRRWRAICTINNNCTPSNSFNSSGNVFQRYWSR